MRVYLTKNLLTSIHILSLGLHIQCQIIVLLIDVYKTPIILG